MHASSFNRRAWLELLRPPNLLTVPGGPLAGFFLATVAGESPAYGLAALTAVVALLLYMAGLIGNDAADYEEDLRDRPSRPLPSGRVPLRVARAAAWVLVLAALILAAVAGRPVFVTALLLQLGIMLYNGKLKHFAWLGALSMGICRGGSLLLGAVAAGWRPVWRVDAVAAAAAGLTLFVAGVTRIADRETEAAVRIGPLRWLPAWAVLAAMTVLAVWHGDRAGEFFMLIAVLSVAWSFHQGAQLHDMPSGQHLKVAVGGLLRGLLPIQAAFCSLGGRPGGIAVAAGLIVLWPLNILVGRRFDAT